MSNTRQNERAPGSVQSVDRAITILELLALKGEASITEIAAELEVHKSTASRLLSALESRGLAEQLGSRGKYVVGMGIVRLAGAVTSNMDLATLGQSTCQEMAEALGETVNVAVFDVDAALNVSQARGSSAVVAQNWVGQRTPLHATSSGKVLLAYLPLADQRALLAEQLQAYTPQTITDPEELHGELELIARDGYARCFEEFEAGLHAIAVPIHGHDGSVVGSLSASGPSFRLSRRRSHQLLKELTAGAHELSGKLGYSGDR